MYGGVRGALRSIMDGAVYSITLGGMMVMIGWIFEIELLKSILPIWVTMKFTTALSFFLSGIILYWVIKMKDQRSDLGQIMLTISALIILLIMASLLLSTFFNIRTGIEDLFVKEQEGAVYTTTPGRPSIGTMLNFILVAFIAILKMFEIQKLFKKLYIIGSIILSIAVLAIIGYLLSIPKLYYSVEGYSTAMAVHTALLFILLGVGFLILKKSSIA